MWQRKRVHDYCFIWPSEVNTHPDFFCVTTIGETHAEASMCSITPAACKRFNSSDTALRTESGRRQSFWRTGETVSSSFTRCMKSLAHPNSVKSATMHRRSKVRKGIRRQYLIVLNPHMQCRHEVPPH